MSKKMKKWGIAAGFVLLSVGVLAGCKKNTPGGILREAMDNAAKVSSYAGNLEIGANMGVKQSGMSVELEIGMDAEVEFTNKPEEYHMNGTVNLGVLNTSMEIELYGKQSKDGKKRTTYLNMADQWVKSEEATKKDSSAGIGLDSLIDKGAKLTLQKDTKKENGKEVYVITTKTSGDKLNSIQDIMGSAADEKAAKPDFSKLEGEVTIKVDKEKRLPASFSVKFSDPSGKGASVENDGAEILIDNFHITMTFDEFDTIDEISLPKEALDAIEKDNNSVDDILNGMTGEDDSYEYEQDEIRTDADGNYIIKDYFNKKEISIAPVAGMELSEFSDADQASFNMEGEDDSEISVRYRVEEMDEYYTEEDLAAYQKEDQEYYSKEESYSDIVFEDVKTVNAGDYEVKYTSLSLTFRDSLFEKAYQAWILTEDGFAVVCDITEETFDTPGTYLNEEKIVQIMSGIKE